MDDNGLPIAAALAVAPYRRATLPPAPRMSRASRRPWSHPSTTQMSCTTAWHSRWDMQHTADSGPQAMLDCIQTPCSGCWLAHPNSLLADDWSVVKALACTKAGVRFGCPSQRHWLQFPLHACYCCLRHTCSPEVPCPAPHTSAPSPSIHPGCQPRWHQGN